ncbi:hypothetical protein ETN89_20540 (plasmid) [Photobacterium damselae subsp. damselae]|uniref:hypothetical protein n=1 Tax=Photobacterium damselae TaxID=38293 RepID=UPI000A2FF314|nr:hypothetical protein [Photobacterium damselae]ARR51892.1 hypothetical protein CAY62_21065 [Photobacterium damselae subsp. damselae]QAY37623.1 hypothetical protein ETN89_20540 [Photobacterium damselae subsp. damselae]
MNSHLPTIINTIKGSKNDLAHYAETVVDLVIDNEFWENVPIVEHAIKLLNIRNLYYKNRLKRNYAAFILSVGTMNDAEINKYSEILFSSGDLGIESAETIFEIISESEKPIKAELLGNLSVSLSRQQISLEDYNTILLVIQSASVAALRALQAFLNANGLSRYKSGYGRIKEEGLLLSLGVATRYGNMFRINDIGILLATHGLKLNVTP